MSYKTYSDLIRFDSFEDRLTYLLLHGQVGSSTFGSHRYLNQEFYTSYRWQKFRQQIILRDMGCDLAHPDFPIPKGVKLFIHHINPISIDDLQHGADSLLDPENVICVTFNTHQAIHYSDPSIALPNIADRKPNDTVPWR